MGAANPHTILRPVAGVLQLGMLGLVAVAATYLGTHGSPDYFEQLVVDALVPLLAGVFALGIAGLGLYLSGRTVVVLIAFDSIAAVGPLSYAFLGLMSRDVRLFLVGLVVAGIPIVGAAGAAIVSSDRRPRVAPPSP